MINELINQIKTLKFSQDCIAATNIFNVLSQISEEEMVSVAKEVALIYPTVKDIAKDPSRSHTPQALFIRNLFSVLKNGTLLDQSNPDRKDHLKHNYERVTDWDASFKFSQILEEEFKKIGNTYGVLILEEMLGHRYGDLAIIGSDVENNIRLMKESYIKSYNAAKSIKCEKQYFTPWYWGACYFSKLNMQKEAVEWHQRFYQEAEGPMKGRPSYKDKLRRSINLMRPFMNPQEFKDYVARWKRSKNSFMKAIFGEFQ